MVTANLYAEWIFKGVSVIGVNAVVQGCCQLVWHSSTEEQGRHFTLNTAAVHWCMVTANLYAKWIFIGVNAAMAQGCCQLVWHSSTDEQGRHFTLKHCSSALVYGDCKPLCRVELQRCKCSRSTRLLTPGLAQQQRRMRQALYP